jgi:hypothetical protein
MAEDEDSTADQLIMSDALVAKLARILKVSGETAKANIRSAVAEARIWHLATEVEMSPTLTPSIAKRQLEQLALKLEHAATANSTQPIQLPTDPGARYFLRWASQKIIGQVPGARHTAANLIKSCDHTAALSFVRLAIEEAERRKMRKSIANPSRPNYARTLLMLAEAYKLATGKSPKQGGKGPSRFERFLKIALDGLTTSRPQSLGRHWKRVQEKEQAKWQTAAERLRKIGQSSVNNDLSDISSNKEV